MAHYVRTAAKIWLGAYDISGDLNSIAIARTQKDLPDPFFGNSFETFIAGLQAGVFSMAGAIELTGGGQDEIFHAQVTQLSNTPITVSYGGAALAALSKFGVIQTGTYQCGGAVGSRAEFSAEGKISNHALVQGQIMAFGLKTGTFNGTAYQLGAVSATQKLYACLHVTAETVNDLVGVIFKVQSDDNAGFTSATDRITFSTVTGITSEFPAPVSGAITDDYWRVICSQWTAGTSAYMVASVGIQ